jgi:RNA polymerase sigma factor for flagellar operon FliA
MDDHERQLWTAFHADRSVENRNALVMCYMPFVVHTVERFVATLPTHAPVEAGDLVNDVVPALIGLIDRYDPSHGNGFLAFASRRIAGQLRDALRNLDWVPRLERRLQKQDDNHRVVAVLPMDAEESERCFDNTDPIMIKLPGAKAEPSLGDVDRYWAFVCQGLDKTDKLIVLMYFRESLTMKQIGDSIGVSESRISQRMKSIRIRLRERFKREDLAFQG